METMDHATAVAPALQEDGVVWENAGGQVSVRLSRHLVGRLGMAVREGFKAIPRRGLETGGLLLGRARELGGQIVVEVDDFEAVECEHAAGPSYRLSDTDRRLLEARIAARATAGAEHSIVGFYRSHTRPDFAITAEDAAIFEAYFPKASDIFLLIKSNDGGPPTGGFIVREGGDVLSGTPRGQFPVTASFAMPATRESSVPSIQISQAPVRTVRSAPPSMLQVRRMIRRPSRLAIATAAALVAGLALGIQAGMPGRTTAHSDPPLGLHVTNTGDGLRLSWNHRASPHATSGALSIRDGNEQKSFSLDAQQLSEGSVAYWPHNSDVNFRLELIAPGSRVTESVRAIGGPSKGLNPAFPADSSQAAGVEAPPAAHPAKPPRPQSRGAVPSRQRSRAFAPPKPKLGSAAAVSASLPDPPAIHPVAALPLGPAGELPKPAPLGAGTSPAAGAEPPFHVVAEPVSGSRLEHVARNIPLIGKRYRHPDYVPPTPLHRPVVPSPPRDLAQEVSVDVKVYVNPSGKVDYSEVISKVPEKHRGLAEFAVFTARRWEFTPAQAGGSPVQGVMILHYRFATAGQPVGNGRPAARSAQREPLRPE